MSAGWWVLVAVAGPLALTAACIGLHGRFSRRRTVRALLAVAEETLHLEALAQLPTRTPEHERR